jgi:hypothetical protein
MTNLTKVLGSTVVIVLLLGLLTGCTSSLETIPTVSTAWSVQIDGAPALIGADNKHLFFETPRSFGNEIEAVSLKSGAYSWSQELDPAGTAQLVGNRLIVTQQLRNDWVVSGLATQDGKQDWVKSFSAEPVGSFANGTFLVTGAGHRLQLANLVGVQGSNNLTLKPGCNADSAIRDPNGGDIYITSDCSNGTISQLLELSPDLRNINSRTYKSGDDVLVPKIYGQYTVITGFDPDTVTVFRSGRSIFSGLNLNEPTFRTLGEALEIIPMTGAPFLIDGRGGRIAWTASNTYLVHSSPLVYATGFESFERFDMYDARSGQRLASQVLSGNETDSLPLSGSDEIQVVGGKNRTIRRLHISATPTRLAFLPLNVRSTTPGNRAGAIGIEITDVTKTGGQSDSDQFLFYGPRLRDVTGTGSILQLASRSSAVSAAKRLNAGSSGTGLYVSHGRCVAHISTNGTGHFATLKAVGTTLFDVAVTKGCNS